MLHKDVGGRAVLDPTPILFIKLELPDLVECTLNKSVLTPACLRVFSSQPDIVQDTTAL